MGMHRAMSMLMYISVNSGGRILAQHGHQLVSFEGSEEYLMWSVAAGPLVDTYGPLGKNKWNL